MPPERTWSGGSAPPSPGYRGHPTRSYLSRAERDNPVGVRARVASGGPTARKADPPAGAGRSEKRMPVAERQRETGPRGAGSSARRGPDNRPDRDDCPDPKGC